MGYKCVLSSPEHLQLSNMEQVVAIRGRGQGYRVLTKTFRTAIRSLCRTQKTVKFFPKDSFDILCVYAKNPTLETPR